MENTVTFGKRLVPVEQIALIEPFDPTGSGDDFLRAAFIEVAQNPGCLYNWEFLAAKQVALAAEFGDAWAHPKPDLRPEFNEWP